MLMTTSGMGSLGPRIQELGLFSPFPRLCSQQHMPRRTRLLCLPPAKERNSNCASRSQIRDIADPKGRTARASSDNARSVSRDCPALSRIVLGRRSGHQSQSRYATRLRSSIAGKPFVVGLGALRRASANRVPMSGGHSSQAEGAFNSQGRPPPPLRSYTPGPPDSSNYLSEQIAKQQRNNFHSTSLGTSIKMVAGSVNKTALHPKGVEYVSSCHPMLSLGMDPRLPHMLIIIPQAAARAHRAGKRTP